MSAFSAAPSELWGAGLEGANVRTGRRRASGEYLDAHGGPAGKRGRSLRAHRNFPSLPLHHAALCELPLQVLGMGTQRALWSYLYAPRPAARSSQ